MKIGSLVYATDQGLGYLAKSFYDHGVLTDVLVIEHLHHPNHYDQWYPNSIHLPIRKIPNHPLVTQFVSSMDVMIFFETPFWWPWIDHCKQIGVKTILMPMHECMPAKLPVQPHCVLCPSTLDLEWAMTVNTERPANQRVQYLPIPVEVPWRQRTKAEVFVHNAGHGGLKGRNGTEEVIRAIEHVRSPAKIVLNFQTLRMEEELKGILNSFVKNEYPTKCTVEWNRGTQLYNQLWNKGDVFLFPEKFNGLSLPLQEARAAGMLVMCGDRFPMNQWLPRSVRCDVNIPPDAEDISLLTPIWEYRKSKVGPPYTEFDEAIIDPVDIAAKIDEWYGRDITDYSLSGREWAQTMSWEVLKPQYMKLIEELVK